jgi:hypothetical protein
MRIRTDLGQRVELVSMDPNCHDISVGLYRKETLGPVSSVPLSIDSSNQEIIQAGLDAAGRWSRCGP